MYRAVISGKSLEIRSPNAIRPWQHVLEPLSGYLTLANKAYSKKAYKYSDCWNFGPETNQILKVKDVLNLFQEKLRSKLKWVDVSAQDNPHEASILSLDCTKAKTFLNWLPRTNICDMVNLTNEWYEVYNDNNKIQNITLEQINRFENL